VTGGSRGIGAAVAKRFTELGATVLTPSRAELDLMEPGSIHEYSESLAVPVDILVNNAGVNWPRPLADVADEVLYETLRVNLSAPIQLTRELAPRMAERGFGRVVNVSSVWALVAREGRSVYAASKAGLGAFTRTIAVEFARRGVLVNAVAPGYVATDLTRQNNSPQELEKIAEAIPVGRLAEPAEIADLIAYLCSSGNTYVTGQVIVCDGGFACR
jgi:3-oxoacyl-[acyl-carrier protein] reductase